MLIGPRDEACPEIIAALQTLGLTLAVAEDFHEAKRVLATQPPDLLITHVRLGAYNGLQLVLRGKNTRPEMAAMIVADAHDPVLERDAAEMDATLVLRGESPEQWIDAARRAMHRADA